MGLGSESAAVSFSSERTALIDSPVPCAPTHGSGAMAGYSEFVKPKPFLSEPPGTELSHPCLCSSCTRRPVLGVQVGERSV